MKKEIIKSLANNFESYAKQTQDGVEFWMARDLQQLLGYSEWRNFLQSIDKAKVSCELSDHKISDHFVDANKTIKMPKQAKKDVFDIMLTRYACYLIAQNGEEKVYEQ